MDDQKAIKKEIDVLAHLESLSKGNSGVLHQDFKRSLKEFGDVTVSQWKEIVQFASKQLGFWEAKLLYSPVRSPDTLAAEEAKEWQLIWKVCCNELVKHVPEVGNMVEQQRTMNLLKYCFERRIDYGKKKPFQRLTVYLLSRIAIVLNKIGIKTISNALYERALYPARTVGRLKNKQI
jgi:hypothetical protein